MILHRPTHPTHKEEKITRGTRGVRGTRHYRKTGEICEISGLYKPECHWDSKQILMSKGWVFPPCFLNENGVLDINYEGTYDIEDVHSAIWHLVKEGDSIQELSEECA